MSWNVHDVNIIDNNRISIFDNNRIYTYKDDIVDGNNEVLIYDFKNELITNYFNNSLIEYDVRTLSNGRSRIIRKNYLFVEETDYGRYLYFNPDGSLQWVYINRNKNGDLYKVFWSRILEDKFERVGKLRIK